jgi:phenylalanyl-tRNA synthetase beta chain
MTISYNWLMDYFQQPIPHDKLSTILNAIGLEVEGYERYEEIKGGLAGLITGEVMTVEKHPNADRLSVTTVNTGGETTLQIVCGAPNVAVGQKVIVATVGTTIYPVSGEPITMRAAKIRGVESMGMICADDEIGLGTDHSGIKILPPDTPVGQSVAEMFSPYEDHVIEIGLTPNRSDAMSHLGVARDICSWLNHHEGLNIRPVIKHQTELTPTGKACPVKVDIENSSDCLRYTGILIEGINVTAAPLWMQQRLKAIGQRSINNIVDITNYILHDTGQPLHAFDADKIKGNHIKVRNLEAGTVFNGLDGKERKLDAGDLMICDEENTPMCMGGVFGGNHSGVTDSTKRIFLESAWFHPVSIRKSSFRHQLRTDAAMHFEKSVDIGQTFEVLKRSAKMMAELAGGSLETDPVDIYPMPAVQHEINLRFDYVAKLSGKVYPPETITGILSGMGFKVLSSDEKQIRVAAPSHKTDVSIPADLVEEIMRIDGFDNIDIPSHITITPAVSAGNPDYPMREKLSGALAGLGFNEMLNNSITHSALYSSEEMEKTVRMLNNLSSELDTLRLTMLETGLQTIARNLNHRNDNLKLFEFGKTYLKAGEKYIEEEHLALFSAGSVAGKSWNSPELQADLYFLKGVLLNLAKLSGIADLRFTETTADRFEYALMGTSGKTKIVLLGKPSQEILKKMDIRNAVWYADINWSSWLKAAATYPIKYREISKFPVVVRDLSFVADKKLTYSMLEKTIRELKLPLLKHFSVFDIFKSEKIGMDKQSMAMNFTFQDETKTLKDTEIDEMMKKINDAIASKHGAEIRK